LLFATGNHNNKTSDLCTYVYKPNGGKEYVYGEQYGWKIGFMLASYVQKVSFNQHCW